jgi:hypothetical protein
MRSVNSAALQRIYSGSTQFVRVGEGNDFYRSEANMKKASWIILTLVDALTMVGSLVSLAVAYTSVPDQIGPATLDELSVGRPEVAVALRARRATAAAYGAGFATLFLELPSDLTDEVKCGRGGRSRLAHSLSRGRSFSAYPCWASNWGPQRR